MDWRKKILQIIYNKKKNVIYHLKYYCIMTFFMNKQNISTHTELNFPNCVLKPIEIAPFFAKFSPICPYILI